VPWPAADLRNWPPSSATRSRIPSSPKPASWSRHHIESDPVVPHLQVQDLPHKMQFEGHRFGTRMAHHVGQRLLRHPKAGCLNGRIDPFQGWVRETLDAKAGQPRWLVEVPAQRRQQPQVVQ
jgi:hypothetical protein